MKTIKAFAILLFLLITITNCNKRSIPPDSIQLDIPTGLKLTSGNQSLILSWKSVNTTDIAGYNVYYGMTSKIYIDTIFVASPSSRTKISNLEKNRCYYCAVAAIDENDNLSELSKEETAFTYLAFDDFSQQQNVLDTLNWHHNIDSVCPVVDGKVAATEIQFNSAHIMRSFGQYLHETPEDNFFVECQFKLGMPNVGGAGLMLRAQRANPDKYYKGYAAYLFWNISNWQLHLEESLIDRYAIHNIQPVKLPTISPHEWVKLSIKYKQGKIMASVFRLSDLSILGTMTVEEKERSRRPLASDLYCGFFTTQYGANTIYTDNFGIGRLN